MAKKVPLTSVLSVFLAALVLAAPAPATPSRAPCEPIRHVAGPTDAPIRVIVYLDPVANRAIGTWLNVRQIVGELDGALLAELRIVRKADQAWPRTRKPDEDRVRAWVMSTSTASGVETALREIDRLGWETLAARLERPDQREELEKQLGLETGETDERCLLRQLGEDSAELSRRHHLQHGSSAARPPVFGLHTALSGERLIINDPALRELRPLIELAISEVRSGRARPLPVPPAQTRSSQLRRDVTRVPGGMRVGGVGRPHHLLVYADGERDPTLHGTLPTALDIRSRYPDILSVQVVARGRRPEAVRLRGRLCAAKRAGLEVEYLRSLGGNTPSASDLPERLDLIAERENCPTADSETNDRGAFLDGAPASASDLRQLERRMEDQARRGPLRWFWLRTDLR